ncbi:MAG: hypothetical protein JW751_11945 [Polyangiaceae bacterium]|nr:hypothetical protein [Polyangiaceae bacterium]
MAKRTYSARSSSIQLLGLPLGNVRARRCFESLHDLLERAADGFFDHTASHLHRKAVLRQRQRPVLLMADR